MEKPGKLSTRNQKLSDCLTLDSFQKIMAAAPHSTNDRVKGLVGMDLIGKRAQYHKSCYRCYFKEVEKLQSVQIPKEATTRQLHADTFSAVASFIESEVIDNVRTMLVSSLFEMYKSEFVANGEVLEDFESYTPKL